LKRIGLVVKTDDEARRQADALQRWLEERGVAVVRRRSRPPAHPSADGAAGGAPADLQALFVLGGDGTFLSAARWIGDADIPLLGVKFGELGFLAEITEERLFAVGEVILGGRFDTQIRMRLQVTVGRDGETVARETVLNDVVINKGALARLAHIETSIDGRYLTTYRADGLIVATPTGSTAYSLAAGGPIIHPAVPGIVMTPICPFTLTNRPLIVPDSAVITLRLDEKSSDIMLTSDGQQGLSIDHRHTIDIRKGDHPIRMITIPGQQYFDVLKTKLRWSGGRV
jgi:NAD+ kinase